jgi:hypothetical protein
MKSIREEFGPESMVFDNGGFAGYHQSQLVPVVRGGNGRDGKGYKVTYYSKSVL